MKYLISLFSLLCTFCSLYSQTTLLKGNLQSPSEAFLPASTSAVYYKFRNADGKEEIASIPVGYSGTFEYAFPQNSQVQLYIYYQDYVPIDTIIQTKELEQIAVRFELIPNSMRFTRETAYRDLKDGKVQIIFHDSDLYRIFMQAGFEQKYGFRFEYMRRPNNYETLSNISSYNQVVEHYLDSINGEDWKTNLYADIDKMIGLPPGETTFAEEKAEIDVNKAEENPTEIAAEAPETSQDAESPVDELAQNEAESLEKTTAIIEDQTALQTEMIRTEMEDMSEEISDSELFEDATNPEARTAAATTDEGFSAETETEAEAEAEIPSESIDLAMNDLEDDLEVLEEAVEDYQLEEPDPIEPAQVEEQIPTENEVAVVVAAPRPKSFSSTPDPENLMGKQLAGTGQVRSIVGHLDHLQDRALEKALQEQDYLYAPAVINKIPDAWQFPKYPALSNEMEQIIEYKRHYFLRNYPNAAFGKSSDPVSLILETVDSDKSHKSLDKVRYWSAWHYEELIPYLIHRITDTSFVGLNEIQEIIIWDRIEAGDMELSGPGAEVQDDLFVISGRANYLLKQLTGEDMGPVDMNCSINDRLQIRDKWVFWLLSIPGALEKE